MKKTGIFMGMVALACATTSCNNDAKKSDVRQAAQQLENAQKADQNPGGVVEVIVKDNGAVVPNPIVREFVIHPAGGHFHFKDTQKDKNLAKGEFEFDLASDTLMKKYITELAAMPAAERVKPNGPPCVGVNGLDFTLIKSSKDTIRFSVEGGLRCNKATAPTAFALFDLLGKIVATGKASPDSHEGHDHGDHKDHDHKGHEGHDHKGHKH